MGPSVALRHPELAASSILGRHGAAATLVHWGGGLSHKGTAWQRQRRSDRSYALMQPRDGGNMVDGPWALETALLEDWGFHPMTQKPAYVSSALSSCRRRPQLRCPLWEHASAGCTTRVDPPPGWVPPRPLTRRDAWCSKSTQYRNTACCCPTTGHRPVELAPATPTWAPAC